MASGPRNKATGYALAVIGVALATGIRLLLGPALGPNFPFATLFVATTGTAVYGGFGPGLASALLGGLSAIRFTLPPDEGFLVEGSENLWGLLLYLTASLALILLGNMVRRARNRAELLAERASRDRDQLRITLASIGDGVIVTDVAGHVVSMNAVAERLTGWKNFEAAGQPLDTVFKVVREGSRDPVENPLSGALRERGVAAVANVILVTRDGRDLWIDNNAAPIRDGDGEVSGVVLVFREIAERRRSEAAQRLLASIVESSQDAIYGKSLEGTITSWNAAAERLYGYSAEEALGQPSTMLTPADKFGEQSAILRSHHETAEHFETVRRRKDGSLIHVSTSISPVRNETGIEVGSSTIARDITPQKRAEEDLRKAQEQLRDADRLKDEFLAVLAHELRNPLAPLHSALGILRRTDGNSSAANEARDMAERQVHHLGRLVDDLLDVSRITHGRVELKREKVELKGVVAHAVETAQKNIQAKGHTLTVALPDEGIWLEADEVRLAQIFANLLNNAAQYTAPGGKIELLAASRGGAVEIRVSDTGQGIAPEALARVFDMFTQVGPKESRSPSSLGIGLRLVRGLVEMHGGRIEAISAGVGRGSAFVVQLPVVSIAETPAAESKPLPPPASTRKNILIVDDNEDAAASLAVLLGLDGHETRVVADGAAALQEVESQAPDIVLLDIGMPGMDGYEVARRLRARMGPSTLTLVALTGWGQDSDRKHAKEAGFDHHLTKPVEPDALLALVAGERASSL